MSNDLDEKTLRETRDHLLEAVQDQRRDLGVPVPDARTAEEFIDPILAQVVHEAADEKPKPTKKPDPAPDVQEKDGKRWMGEPEHSAELKDGWTFFKEDAGTLDWDLSGNILKPQPGCKLAQPDPREARLPPRERDFVNRIRLLMTMPEYRKQLQRVAMHGHRDHVSMLKAYERIVEDSYRTIPDANRPRERKIIVAGR